MSSDPWSVLGVPPGSSLAEARAARRRLAKQVHPDLHGGQADLSARMALVNQALAQIEAQSANSARREPSATVAAHPSGPTDPVSFSVDFLPAEAFEALFLAAYGLGDILVADEPYLLELYLSEPPCFCRLTLVPEAGASLVTVEVAPAAGSLPGPEPSEVIDILVSEFNSLVAG